MTFEELRLGVPKLSYFSKFIAMTTRGEPSKDEHFCELFDMNKQTNMNNFSKMFRVSLSWFKFKDPWFLRTHREQ